MDQKCSSSHKINGGNGEQWDCKTQPTCDIIGSVEKCVYVLEWHVFWQQFAVYGCVWPWTKLCVSSQLRARWKDTICSLPHGGSLEGVNAVLGHTEDRGPGPQCYLTEVASSSSVRHRLSGKGPEKEHSWEECRWGEVGHELLRQSPSAKPLEPAVALQSLLLEGRELGL